MLNFSHLSQVNETYLEHLKFGLWAGIVLFILGIISIIHAVFPFLFDRIPDKIFRYFLKQSNERITRVNKILKDKGLEQ